MVYITDPDQVRRLSGFLPNHIKCFLRVASQTHCAIMVRAVGPKVTGLLAEGYATKPLAIKTKSNAWGPAAGFVCADSRFSKESRSMEGMHVQTTSIVGAVRKGDLKGVVPIHITRARMIELVRDLHLITLVNTTVEDLIAGEKLPIIVCNAMTPPPHNRPVQFFLEYNPICEIERHPSYHPDGLWKIKYSGMLPPHYGIDDPFWAALKESPISRGLAIAHDDVLGLADPHAPPEAIGNFRIALTGDYDLFTVFTPRELYTPDADDRIVKHSELGTARLEDYAAHMHPQFGNTTHRIELMIGLLNNCMNYPAGKILHHGDEAGRPLVRSIEFPFVCFIPPARMRAFASPARSPWAKVGYAYIDDIEGFKILLRNLYDGQFILNINPGWWAQLGFSRTAQGSFEV